jgi:hypothetical protein
MELDVVNYAGNITFQSERGGKKAGFKLRQAGKAYGFVYGCFK